MTKREMTGKMRCRLHKRLFGEPLLVLQVEIHETGFTVEYPGCEFEVDEKYWRDAKATDLLGLP